MNLGIRTKLFLVSLALIAASLLVADLFLTRALDRLLIDHIREDLRIRAQMVEQEAGGLPLRSDPAWDRLARSLQARAGARITFVALDGRVLGESDVLGGERPGMENHRERPEILEALKGDRGSSIRHSSTLAQRMLYVALPIRREGATLGVVRLATPLSEVDEAIGKLRRILLLASLFALGIATVVAFVVAHRTSRTLRLLTEAASRMAGGDLAQRTRASGHDEIATLGRSLDQLARSLGQALDQLKTERDLLSAILEGMQEGILVTGPDGRIVHMNPALRDMLLAGADAVGKPLLEVIRNADLAELLAGVAGSGQPGSAELELGGLKPRHLLAATAPLQGGEGKLLTVLMDMTQVRRLESVRRDFVANASHELRTPVASVRSAAETLRTAASDPVAARTFLDIIERNAERLQHLIDDLLDLSRIESRQFRLLAGPLELGAFVAGVVEGFREAAGKKRLDLVEDPSLKGTAVKADRLALEQALGNFLDNAVKYCTDDSTVRIWSEQQGSTVRIHVTDTGPGIPAQHLPRIFERFYRVDAGRSRELGGTGLGLAIVRHLAEAMGGSVTVESAVGKGSDFVISLPAA